MLPDINEVCMCLKRNVLLSILITSTLVTQESCAQHNTNYAVLDDQAGALIAMNLGSNDFIDIIIKHGANDQRSDLFSAAKYRILFDLERSTAEADKCYAQESGIGTKDATVFATICGIISAGNLWLEGDISGWAKKMLQMRDWAYPRLRNAFQSSVRLQEFEINNYSAVADWPKLRGSETDQPSFAVPIVWKNLKPVGRSIDTFHPLVTVTINGHLFNMVLDTGSSISAIDTHDAETLGISSTVTDFANALDANARATKIRLGLIDSLTFGKSELRNVPITIRHFPFPVLGLNALVNLGAVRLDENEVNVLSRDDSKVVECGNPLTVGSGMVGLDLSLAMPIFRSGHNSLAFLDTGDDTYFAGIAPPGDSPTDNIQTHTRTTNDGGYQENYYIATELIGLGKKLETLKFPVRIDPNHLYHQPAVVGAPALKAVSVFLDFRGRRACFLPKA